MKLETERLTLREFYSSDYEKLYQYQNDPRYLEFYDKSNNSEIEVKQLLNLFLDWQQKRPRLNYQFGIELKTTKVLIGSCGYRIYKDNFTIAEIGFELDPNHWKKGFMLEALTRLIEHIKAESKINTLKAWCNPSRRFRVCGGILYRLGPDFQLKEGRLLATLAA